MDAYTMELMAGEQRRDRLTEAAARRLLRAASAGDANGRDSGRPSGGSPARWTGALGGLTALRRLARFARLAPTA